MSDPKATPKNHLIDSPLLRFRQRANCNLCTLCDACLNDKTLETRCILALLADNIHNAMRLQIMKGPQQ